MSRYIDSLNFVKLHEQSIQIGKWKLSYLFFPCKEKSDRLIVFCGGNNYGYTRSFYNQEVGRSNLLYIKDNLSPDGKSLWWMAFEGDFSVSESYVELIRISAEKCDVDIENICYIGNSQGGFGALYLSFIIGAGKVVAIAPYIAVADVYPDSPLIKRIIGNTGMDLNDYIFKHFGRHTEVIVHIFSASNDKMMKTSRLSFFIDLMLKRNNLFVLKNFKINHPKEISNHSAISYSIFSEEIIKEFDQSFERFYKLDK